MLSCWGNVMSVQFGQWNFHGEPVLPDDLDRVDDSALARYGPDAKRIYSAHGIHILYRAFYTTTEARHEIQPHVANSGAVVTWDGRLDNRNELIGRLQGPLSIESSDVEIVAAAYERWGLDCLPQLVGDWALSVWNSKERRLLLAKDFVGTRHLFYSISASGVSWATLLDPLLTLSRDSFEIEEEYIAGWLGFLPRPDLTPYRSIRSVPPSTSILITPRKISMREYWRFDPSHRIHYRTDKEYEDHFRAAFAESVKRRLRSEGPVLAELSGGTDSSSIVCMADRILSHKSANSTRLDTISYYDDSEPDWDELPYLTKVEEARGRIGFHINAGVSDTFLDIKDVQRLRVAPAFCGVSPTHASFAAYQRAHGHRIVLSGIGGDEVLGGVPAPGPELADLLARAEIGKFSQRLVRWALVKRRPVLHLAAETVRQFLPAWFNDVADYRRPPSWLTPKFARRYRSALEGYNTRLRLLGPLPSFQENLSTFEVLRRQLAVRFPAVDSLCEVRYPYLDRNLVEFLYSVPREQILRPNQRRSLMRRALAGIVPEEVLNRRRKGFVVKGAIRLLNSASHDLLQNMVSSDLGIVDANVLAIAIAHAREGREVSLVALLRTIELERWLRSWTCATPSKGLRANVRESRPVPEPRILHSDRATL